MRIKKYFTVFILALVLMNSAPLSASAFEKITEEIVFIAVDEIIDDNLMIFSDTVDIEGTIKGDLIVTAGVANIKGVVEGDVIAVGGDITISGVVQGDVRTMSGTLRIENVVGGNVTAVSGKVSIGNEAEIGHSITIATGLFENNGAVVKNINIAAGNISINGPVGGSINAYLDEEGQIVLLSDSRIGGDINYTAQADLARAPGAEVAGIIRKIDSSSIVTTSDFPLKEIFLFLKIVSLLGALVVGLLCINLFPKASESLTKTMLKEPYKLVLLGFVYFFLTPLALLLLTITIIGIPLAMIIFVLFIVIMYLAKIAVALAIGNMITTNSTKKDVGLFFALFFGILAVYIISSLPFIGWFISILISWWGLAGIIQWLNGHYKNGI